MSWPKSPKESRETGDKMAKAKPKKSFILYTDIREALSQLDDATRGKLFLHIVDYVDNGVVPDMELLEKLAFTFIKSQIDRDSAKYQDTCEKRKLAGSKGGKARAENQAKQANATFSKQNQASQADNDSDNDNDNENESDNDSDKKYICAEPLQASTPEPEEPAVISLPLNDKTWYPITQKQVDEWSGLYPAVDVMQELRKMLGWLDANTSNRKTRRGIKSFVNRWLSKEQDRGGSRQRQQAYQPPAPSTRQPEQDEETRRFIEASEALTDAFVRGEIT